VDQAAFQLPTKYSVNGIMTNSPPKESDDTQVASMPLSVIIAALVAGLTVFGVMFYYSRYGPWGDTSGTGPTGGPASALTPSTVCC
jgi:hypothetical protein